MQRLILILLLIPSMAISAEQGSFTLSNESSGVTATIQQTDRTVIDLKIAKLDYENTDSNGQINISLPEEFNQTRGSYLGPESVILPTITRLVAIPIDANPSFRIIKSNIAILDNIDLAPADLEDLDALSAIHGIGGISGQPELVRGEVAGVMRDLRLYALTISPVQYDPRNHQLRACRELEIELSHPGSQITSYRDHISEAFTPVYRSIVDNPQVFDPVRSTRGAYWILYPDVFQNNIQPLIDWEKAKGFDVVTISKNQLGTNSYMAIRDTIRNRFEAAQLKPDYIVIIGDVVMPGGIGIASKTYANPFGFGSIDSDNFYTFLVGNDYFPEVFIGRISVDNINEMSAYFGKLFQYERTPYLGNMAWYGKAAVVAGSEDGYLVSSRLTKLWCRDIMLRHGFTQVDTFFADFSHPVPPSDINASINSGVAFVNYRGWGTADGWTPPDYSSTNIIQLANSQMFPIMTSIVCGTGDFNDNDSQVDVCFGETWIRASNKGGAGFIGNSNHDAHTRWTNAIDCGIYWGLFEEGVVTLAQAELMGKMTLYNAFPGDRAPNGEVELYFNSYNVLGDPEINCWTAIPKAIRVTYPDSIPLGQNLVDVHVQDTAGVPLEGAIVCLWKQTEVFEVGFTGAEGNYGFQITPSSPGEMRITATGKGFIPLEDSIAIFSHAVTIGFQSFTIDDNTGGGFSGDGDGTLNPSERAGLAVTLVNYGVSDTAYGVTANLISRAPGVAVERGQANYATIAPGTPGSPDLPFILNIGADVSNGTVAPLLLEISDNAGHHWQGIMRIPVLAAQIAFDSVSVVFEDGNGQIDPGEIFGLVFHARNIGPKGIFSPQVTLRSSDSHIHFIDSVATLGNIVSLDTASNGDDPFIASIDQDVYIGRHINFNVVFTGAGPQISATTFSKTVGTVTSDDPIGPDNYGYYCFDNTDTTYPFHPTYNWIDISTSWPHVTLSDDDVATIGLPFPIQYYGQTFDSVTICDNGFIAMGTITVPNFFNAPIPAPQDAEAMIAPFWDDFTQTPLLVYYQYDTTGARFVIGWRNAYNGDNFRNQTFEIIFLDQAAWPTLTQDNEIIFQYNLAQSPTTMSVGICSPDRVDGIGYVFNNRYDPGAATIASGRAVKFTTGSLYSTVANESPGPTEFALAQNYPNPFNATTTIKFDLPASDHVTIDIFNVLGQKITTLADGDFAAGTHGVIWDANRAASGLYFYRFTSGQKVFTNRMTLLR